MDIVWIWTQHGYGHKQHYQSFETMKWATSRFVFHLSIVVIHMQLQDDTLYLGCKAGRDFIGIFRSTSFMPKHACMQETP